MPILPLTESNLTHYRDRLSALEADTPRLWGSMSPAEMLNHVRCLILVSLGQQEFPDVSNVLTRSGPVKFLLLAAPWPKGKIKAPLKLQVGDEAGSFEAELGLLQDALHEFARATHENPNRMGRSPFLGPVPLSYWAKLQGKHLDHHLRQFGS